MKKKTLHSVFEFHWHIATIQYISWYFISFVAVQMSRTLRDEPTTRCEGDYNPS